MSCDLDPRDTAEVRRRVLLPVAHSLLTADELEDVRAVVGPLPGLAVDVLTLAVKARGEWLDAPRWWTADHLCDSELLAGEFYDLLRDQLAESYLAWGELREGSYLVPLAE